MTAQTVALIRTWKVGSREVTMTAPRPEPDAPVCIAMEWLPTVPNQLSDAEWRQYRDGRDAALRDLLAEFSLAS